VSSTGVRRSPPSDDVRAAEAHAEAAVGAALDQEAAADRAVREALADRAVHAVPLVVAALEDHDAAAQGALADAVLRAAVHLDVDGRVVEGAQAVAGDGAGLEVQLHAAALAHAAFAGERADEVRAEGAFGAGDGTVAVHDVVLALVGDGVTDPFAHHARHVVEGFVDDAASDGLPRFGFLDAFEQFGQVEGARLRGEEVAAAAQVREAAQAEARHDLAITDCP